MLIREKNIDLIIAEETVHEGEYFTLDTVINNLVNERSGILSLGQTLFISL
jgi:hypothetical protein